MNRLVVLFAVVLASAAPSLRAASMIANVSSYGLVGTSAGSLVASLVVEGTATKNVLIRGVGPGLTAFGVTRPSAAVDINVYDSAGSLVAFNRGFQTTSDRDTVAAVTESVGAFPLADPGDSALLLALAPGAYSVEVEPSAADSPDGHALLEIYDADDLGASSQITRQCTRGQIGAAAGALTAGLIVAGDAPKFILIRGVGPDLTPPDTAHDAPNLAPVDLSVFDSKGNLVAFTSGQFKNPNEVLVTLMPGAYTVQATLTVPDAAGGIATVEVSDADAMNPNDSSMATRKAVK